MEKLETAQIKQIELNILKTFGDFCSEYNLSYSLFYGTLLGCIRHKGFIPWDDDVDVIMPRYDYERLIELRDIYEKKYKNISFKNCGDKDYPFPFLKITDNTTLVEEKEILAKYRYGVWIDVFPLDTIPLNIKKHRRHTFVVCFMKKILIKSIIVGKNIGDSCFSKLINRFFLIPLAHIIGHIIDIPYLCNKESKRFLLIKNNQFADYIWDPKTPVFDIHKIFPPAKGLFEGFEFDIPNDADYCLRMYYGDYMILPPESERFSHLTAAWRIK